MWDSKTEDALSPTCSTSREVKGHGGRYTISQYKERPEVRTNDTILKKETASV